MRVIPLDLENQIEQQESDTLLAPSSLSMPNFYGPSIWCIRICRYSAISLFVPLLLLCGAAAVMSWTPTARARVSYTAFDVYCRGPILQAIQMADWPRGSKLRDGKNFVDLPMKRDADAIYTAFAALKDHSLPTLERFLDDNFEPAGSDLIPAIPLDYKPNPFQDFRHEALQNWANDLNALWKDLGRERPKDLPIGRHSFLETKHLLIVPGGRFRENYYWDTYWIVQGLLACGMHQTARGMIENLLDFVDTYGFCPNGGRIYYLTRSQPPMLSEMVRIYLTDEVVRSTVMDRATFLARATAILDKEYQYWMTQGENGHAVQLEDGSVLNRYVAAMHSQPRPESYREDVELMANSQTSSPELFRELIAATESGWDFSSRWFAEDGGTSKDSQSLSTSITSHILPVDLNCFLQRMEFNLAEFHSQLEDSSVIIDFYRNAIRKREVAMERYFWHEPDFVWRDYNFVLQSPRSAVTSVSNFFPLWSMPDLATNPTKVDGILRALKVSGLFQGHGVLTTTTKNSGQQWDAPNAWPPLQEILIDGLINNLGQFSDEADKLGRKLVQTWIDTGFRSWQETGHMYEKYDALVGGNGGGGEYNVQLGFGWSNGVILKLLTQYEGTLSL